MAVREHFEVAGSESLIRAFDQLAKPSTRRKLERAAVAAAGTVIKKAVAKAWPKDTGFAAKSVRVKIVKTKTGFTAIIGIEVTAIQRRPDGTSHIPSKIDHLIEFGYQLATGQRVAAKAPLRRGFEAGRNVALAKFHEKLSVGLDREIAKLKSNARL